MDFDDLSFGSEAFTSHSYVDDDNIFDADGEVRSCAEQSQRVLLLPCSVRGQPNTQPLQVTLARKKEHVEEEEKKPTYKLNHLVRACFVAPARFSPGWDWTCTSAHEGCQLDNGLIHPRAGL